MKIRTHYVYGKKRQVACGKTNVCTTTNFREITCKLCLKTHKHREVKATTTHSFVGNYETKQPA